MKLLLLLAPLLAYLKSGAQTDIATDSLPEQPATATLVFCGGIENDLPVGISDRFFRETSGNAYIYAYYSQQNALAMKQVLMELHLSSDTAGAVQTFSVKPKWKYTFLKCYFPAAGEYRVTLYDENKNVLAGKTVTILAKEP